MVLLGENNFSELEKILESVWDCAFCIVEQKEVRSFFSFEAEPCCPHWLILSSARNSVGIIIGSSWCQGEKDERSEQQVSF